MLHNTINNFWLLTFLLSFALQGGEDISLYEQSKSSSAEDRQRDGNCLCWNGYLDVLWVLSRAIIARYFSTREHGVFNLALTVLSSALAVATLGFQNSLPREVAFYREGLFESQIFD